jgi:hypothetical protein
VEEFQNMFIASSTRLAIVASLILALLAGCAGMEPPPAQEDLLAPAFRVPAAGALIVLMPGAPVGAAESAGTHLALVQLDAQLRAAGYRVVAVDDANFADLWKSEIQVEGDLYDPHTGKPRGEALARIWISLARRIGEQTHCALVLDYQLVPRSAVLSGRKAGWDGVVRDVPFKRGSERYEASGRTPALSVELLGFSPSGDLLLRQFGGTSLVYRVNTIDLREEIRPDLFLDDKETAEGVHVALRALTRR